MAGWEYLQDVGAFRFDDAVAEVDASLEPTQPREPDTGQEEALDMTRDLVLLGAAAVQVGRQIAAPDLERLSGPAEVGPIDARISFLKFDCAGTFIHGRRSEDELGLWDVVAFTGDIAKLRVVGVASVSELSYSFNETFGRLMDLYAASSSSLAKRALDTGWLHLEGLVWRTTLARLVAPERLESDVSSFAERFESAMPHLTLPQIF